MTIPSFLPQVSVVLKKNIGRKTVGADVAASERFQGSKREIDLTPYIGEGGQVIVRKNVREAEGMFSVTLVDKMVPDQEETLYGLIEAMDVIEIRMARSTAPYFGKLPKHMPLMMRGLVSIIGRGEVMTMNGPRRGITISGQDYGKILRILRIIYIPGMVLGQDLLSAFKLFLNYDVAATAYSDASAFVKDVVTKVVGEFTAKMRAKGTAPSAGTAGGDDAKSPIMDILVDAKVGSGSISPFGANEWPGGTVHELLAYFGDVGAWNELFIEDREDAPYLVFRPNPFKDIKGAFIQSGEGVRTATVADKNIVSIDASRTDANVANYFWVDAPRYNLVDGTLLQAAAQDGQMAPNPFLTDYANSDPIFYGIRPLEVQTQQGERIDGQPEADIEAGKSIGIEMVNGKRRLLIEQNKDNGVLESGSLILRGDETIRGGTIVTVKRGGDKGLAYEVYGFEAVHEFTWGGAYLTTVNFDRGTGFVERIKRGKGTNSPYLAERSAREEP